MIKLPTSYFQNPDVVFLAQDLLGKKLTTFIDGYLCSGIITETEAYSAPEDKASHAFGNKKTPRTAPFFAAGGIAYVYLCYGIHYLFNIVTNVKDVPHAILIRAIEPTEGLETMMARRKKTKFDTTLTTGPGAVAQALGINKNHNEALIGDDKIWISDVHNLQLFTIVAGPRIGVAYAQEYAEKPWRFWIKDHKFVSKKK